jgi:hypothetical protein
MFRTVCARLLMIVKFVCVSKNIIHRRWHSTKLCESITWSEGGIAIFLRSYERKLSIPRTSRCELTGRESSSPFAVNWSAKNQTLSIQNGWNWTKHAIQLRDRKRGSEDSIHSKQLNIIDSMEAGIIKMWFLVTRKFQSGLQLARMSHRSCLKGTT